MLKLFRISFDTLENTVGMQEIQRKALFVLNLLEMSVNVYDLGAISSNEPFRE